MKTALILLVLSLNVMASDVQVYRFADTVVSFKTVDGMLVNKTCELPVCEALKNGKELGKAALQDDWLEGGKNPFAVRCKQIMKGTVMIGVDIKGNENAFCVFKDGSYLR